MRVVERAQVAALGYAHVGDLDVELRLAQSASLDEGLDCVGVSDVARDVRLRNVYVLDGEFSGATRGFLSAGSTRRETIFAMVERIATNLIRADARGAVVDAESGNGFVDARCTRRWIGRARGRGS